MSSRFIVIPTGNKKKNRKWVKGKLFTPLLPPPTILSSVYFDCNYFIHWIWRSPVIFGVINSYQYPLQDGNKFIILMWPVFVFRKGIYIYIPLRTYTYIYTHTYMYNLFVKSNFWYFFSTYVKFYISKKLYNQKVTTLIYIGGLLGWSHG